MKEEKIKEILIEAEERCIKAVEYVDAANYREEAEARISVRKVFGALIKQIADQDKKLAENTKIRTCQYIGSCPFVIEKIYKVLLEPTSKE